MTVKRIVANVAARDEDDSAAFYCDLLGLEVLMDLGWITTYGSTDTMPVQLSVATEGGSGTPVPNLSIEVDDVDAVWERAQTAGFDILYGIVDEPWGVRRFYVRDPMGKVVNVLAHIE